MSIVNICNQLIIQLHTTMAVPTPKIYASTTVVNIKVAQLRGGQSDRLCRKYDNLREWMAVDEHVYIGRAGIVFVPTDDGGKERWPKAASKWANPYKIDASAYVDQMSVAEANEEARAESIRLYTKYVSDKIAQGELDPRELIGKTLGCWCHPEACHGDVLAKLANLYTVETLDDSDESS